MTEFHKVIAISMPKKLDAIIERERGDISRSKFIVRALEKGLELGNHKTKREVFTNG